MLSAGAGLVIALVGWMATTQWPTLPPLPTARGFGMGMTYWPPAGWSTPDSLIVHGLNRTLTNSEYVQVQIPWNPQSPDLVAQAAWMAGVARAHGKKLIIAIEWLDEDRRGLRNAELAPWAFADPAVRVEFLNRIVQAAETYVPEYFVLGVEVNYYALLAPQDFPVFVALFREAHSILRVRCPDMIVSVSFQYELLTGRSRHWNVPAQQHLIEAFGPELGLIGIASYPNRSRSRNLFLPGAGYYDELHHLHRPLAVFEVGWPTTAAGRVLGSGLAEFRQRVFLARALNQFARLRCDLVLWASTTDAMADEPGQVVAPGTHWKQNLGLWRLDGSPKSAAQVWIDWSTTSWDEDQ